MPGDIAGWLSEGVAYPTPLAPSYLDVDSFLFSSCPQFFIPYEHWPLNAHDGSQASVEPTACWRLLLLLSMSLSQTGGQTLR